MAKYITFFVLPVHKDNVDAYRRMARRVGKIWREHGALDFKEYIADDVQPGTLTSFPQSVKLKPGEVVVCAYATYKSKAHRDRVMEKECADPRTADIRNSKTMPFDTKRMFWGSFKLLVSV